MTLSIVIALVCMAVAVLVFHFHYMAIAYEADVSDGSLPVEFFVAMFFDFVAVVCVALYLISIVVGFIARDRRSRLRKVAVVLLSLPMLMFCAGTAALMLVGGETFSHVVVFTFSLLAFGFSGLSLFLTVGARLTSVNE